MRTGYNLLYILYKNNTTSRPETFQIIYLPCFIRLSSAKYIEISYHHKKVKVRAGTIIIMCGQLYFKSSDLSLPISLVLKDMNTGIS